MEPKKHHFKFQTILDHLFGEENEGVCYEEIPHRLAEHVTSLKKQGTVYFERVNYGQNEDCTPLLATKIGREMIPDFDFWHCEDIEIVKRFGVEAAVIAAYVKEKVRRIGQFTVDTRTGEITPARKPVPE